MIAATVLAAPLAAGAQPANVPRIGVLSGSFLNDAPCLDALRRGLSELGYVEGRTHVFEVRYAEGRTDTFPSLAAELVRLNPDLIVSEIALGAVAMKEATASIPIVLASSLYPVELGVVASLAHPGGNVTGVTHFTPELVPNPLGRSRPDYEGASRYALALEVRGLPDLAGAFESARRLKVDAVVVFGDAVTFLYREKIAELALKKRLPTFCFVRENVEAGGLMAMDPISLISGVVRLSTSRGSSRVPSPPICPSNSPPSLS